MSIWGGGVQEAFTPYILKNILSRVLFSLNNVFFGFSLKKMKKREFVFPLDFALLSDIFRINFTA